MVTNFDNHWDHLPNGRAYFSLSMFRNKMSEEKLKDDMETIFIKRHRISRHIEKCWRGKVNSFTKEIIGGHERIYFQVVIEQEIICPQKYQGYYEGWYIEEALSIAKEESSKSDFAITKESIEKITLAKLFDLIKNLSIGAIGCILAFLLAIVFFSFKVGYYYRELVQSSISNRLTLSLEQLNSYQISLLKEIYKYQKKSGANKVIINRIGFIIDETTNKDTSINVAVNVLGNRANQAQFEDLIISMPEYFLKRLPSTRFDDPYVLSVTEEAKKLLNKSL